MKEIIFENLTKSYGKNTVVDNLNLTIKEGERLIILGPSGCGKSTILRMIAGLEDITSGKMYMGGKCVNDVKSGDRNIGMVFQNYAIFPHLTVKQNVAFGLENRKIEKSQIDEKVEDIMKVVKIDEYKDRLPENLSGGQQQRVALARAIVIHPDVLLMDEPLCNLDAKLRVEMRNAIKEIQNNIGITTIYVTHDQEEAMAISDRIAVMREGVIQHVGTPKEIYQRPANIFVASFIGNTNILDRKLSIDNGKAILHLSDTYSEIIDTIDVSKLDKNSLNVKVSIRPEDFIICNEEKGIKAVVLSSIFLGLNTHYFVELESNEKVEIIQESTIGKIFEAGSKIGLTIKAHKINVFSELGDVNYTKSNVGDIYER